MWSIGNGKSKFIYDYKAAELIKSKPKNYRYPNYLTSYNKFFYNNPDSIS